MKKILTNIVLALLGTLGIIISYAVLVEIPEDITKKSKKTVYETNIAKVKTSNYEEKKVELPTVSSVEHTKIGKNVTIEIYNKTYENKNISINLNELSPEDRLILKLLNSLE